ncbi:MAG: 23S rRNA (uracil(1939)-C(5))-methyltransferase RlmD [Acidobacteriia bacterium]|nr:23S rRNA (uracil(1939)-C(5))-methyltransferase RlmD [Terriglobia bacterium]
MPFELIPHKLVYGGEALGHHQGRTVLVPRALPGERVEVEEHRTAKGVVHARPVRILAAAPERVEAPCPYFGRCGGCQYQHMDAQFQATAKREILRETLRRIGKIDWSADIPLHAANPWNYRNQAELKVRRLPDGSVVLGFFEAESHRLCPVDSCLILSPRLNSLLAELRGLNWSPRLAICQEIEILADDRDERAAMTLRAVANTVEGENLVRDMLANLAGVVGMAIETGGEFKTFGDAQLEYVVGEFRYGVSPGSFFQASRFLLPDLVNAVVAEQDGRLALDLFAGVGLFALPLARRFSSVIAVEAAARAAHDLGANARVYSFDHVRAVAQTTYDFLRRFAQTQPDLVVLDPPRAGVGAQTLELLVSLQPKRIHYVSCSPPTLARDLAYLAGHGYELRSVDLFDFFPQTFHIEALVRLVRRAA